MTLVLDASMALAWLILRVDPTEAAIARRACAQVQAFGARVPAIWYPEVANTLLVFERASRLTVADSAKFLGSLALLSITKDERLSGPIQPGILALGRAYTLSAYDSSYLDLAIYHSATLATFDRKLAQAARSAGIRVFGDPAHP